MPRILACIVLYNTPLSGSETYRTLRQAAALLPETDGQVTLFVADNSAEPTELPENFQGSFLHDGKNPGLAHRYNQALKAALEGGYDWLLTLDQDTTLTAAYIEEMLQLTRELIAKHSVAVILPKLTARHKLYSPHTSSYRRSRAKVDDHSYGILGDTIYGFNSAAVVRVSALQSIGGYDERYWLDYLDHATFARLQRSKWCIYVMKSTLHHELSVVVGGVSTERLANILRAEQMFYTEHSYGFEWLGRKLDLLRQVVGHGRRGRFLIAGEKARLLIGRIP